MSLIISNHDMQNRIIEIPDPIADAVLLCSLLVVNYGQRLFFCFYYVSSISDEIVTDQDLKNHGL